MFRKNLSTLIFYLALLFLVVFPKGGIKVGGLPLTWGYLIISLSGLFLLIQGKYRFSPLQFYAYLALIPFQVISIITLFHNGISHTGYAAAFLITFFLLPPFMYILFGEYSFDLFSPPALQFLKKGILFLALYGIGTFMVKTFFGYFIHIPFLTMNFSDLATFETSKCIERGSLFKLISTYTNGNLYGVCLLMLTPLYYQLEPKTLPRLIVRLSLILTLSRTVWVGYILFEGLYFLFFSKKKGIHLIYLCILMALFASLLTTLLPKITELSTLEFLFDPTLGGRLSEEKNGIVPTLFSLKPFLNISEIVYLGMLENFGALGLMTYCMGIMMPLLLWALDPLTPKTPLYKAMALGLVNYLILSFSDGCILLIPTMALYLGLSSALLAKPSRSLTKEKLTNNL